MLEISGDGRFLGGMLPGKIGEAAQTDGPAFDFGEHQGIGQRLQFGGMMISPSLDIGLVGGVAGMAHQLIPLTRSQRVQEPEKPLLIEPATVVEAEETKRTIQR